MGFGEMFRNKEDKESVYGTILGQSYQSLRDESLIGVEKDPVNTKARETSHRDRTITRLLEINQQLRDQNKHVDEMVLQRLKNYNEAHDRWLEIYDIQSDTNNRVWDHKNEQWKRHAEERRKLVDAEDHLKKTIREQDDQLRKLREENEELHAANSALRARLDAEVAVNKKKSVAVVQKDSRFL